MTLKAKKIVLNNIYFRYTFMNLKKVLKSLVFAKVKSYTLRPNAAQMILISILIHIPKVKLYLLGRIKHKGENFNRSFLKDYVINICKLYYFG